MRAPIAKQKTYELIAEQLLAEIGTRLQPGDALPTERELTDSFKVGRSSVREGLRMLESRGVIEPIGNGTFVVSALRSPLNRSLSLLLSLEEANLRELYELRWMLEGEAAALAAERRSDADLATMRTAIEEMAEGLGDRETYASADVRFHVAVAAATGNRVALHAMHAIRDLLERALEQVYGIPGSAARSLEQHRQILDAIEAGQAEEARSRMRTHLTRVEREIHDAVTTSRIADFSTPPATLDEKG
jgi:GntR family transcriptional regulator, transcriptional repressor for pyruvate dehydrogenase complex